VVCTNTGSVHNLVMELPTRWHSALVTTSYVLIVLWGLAISAVMGINERHQNHPLLYGSFAVGGLIAAWALYCAFKAGHRYDTTKRVTTGPCANQECSREVYWDVNRQSWLHLGSFKVTCAKKLDTVASPVTL